MSRQTSKTAIGAFVVGAIGLIVVALIIFGSGTFFSRTYPCVFYFEGSVQGLSTGSPVKFKGVQVGEVTDVGLMLDSEELKIKIPVRAVLYSEKLALTRGKWDKKNLERAIENGLRAQLKTQNLITGQLMVDLDFYPDKPLRYLGDGSVQEIPTIPTVIEELAKMIKDIHFEEILENLTRAVEGIEQLVNSPELASSIQSFDVTLRDIQEFVQTAERRVDPLADSIGSAADEYGRLAKNINEELDAISGKLEKTLASAQATAEQMENMLTNTAGITADGSPLMHELTRSLREISAAARSMRRLTDYLERNPESVIFGKGDSR